MSLFLTDNQRKRVAKWLTRLIFGYLFEWLLPWILGIIALAILSAGLTTIVILLLLRHFSV